MVVESILVVGIGVADRGDNALQLIRVDQVLGMEPMEFADFFLGIIGEVDTTVPFEELALSALQNFRHDEIMIFVMENCDVAVLGIKVGDCGCVDGMEEKTEWAGREEYQPAPIPIPCSVERLCAAPDKKQDRPGKQGAVSFRGHAWVHADGAVGQAYAMRSVAIAPRMREFVRVEMKARSSGMAVLGKVHVSS